MPQKMSGKVIIRAFPILSFHSLNLEFSTHNDTLLWQVYVQSNGFDN